MITAFSDIFWGFFANKSQITIFSIKTDQFNFIKALAEFVSKCNNAGSKTIQSNSLSMTTNLQ